MGIGGSCRNRATKEIGGLCLVSCNQGQLSAPVEPERIGAFPIKKIQCFQQIICKKNFIRAAEGVYPVAVSPIQQLKKILGRFLLFFEQLEKRIPYARIIPFGKLNPQQVSLDRQTH